MVTPRRRGEGMSHGRYSGIFSDDFHDCCLCMSDSIKVAAYINKYRVIWKSFQTPTQNLLEFHIVLHKHSILLYITCLFSI